MKSAKEIYEKWEVIKNGRTYRENQLSAMEEYASQFTPPAPAADVRRMAEEDLQELANKHIEDMYGKGCYGRYVDKLRKSFIAGYTSVHTPVPDYETLFNHMATVKYEAWGHEAVMIWCIDGVWRAGLRNSKLDGQQGLDKLSAPTAYKALYRLYEYCLENNFVKPLPQK